MNDVRLAMGVIILIIKAKIRPSFTCSAKTLLLFEREKL
jgi:hypothetical protein